MEDKIYVTGYLPAKVEIAEITVNIFCRGVYLQMSSETLFTLAPDSHKMLTTSLPIKPVPPVTTAVLFFNKFVIFSKIDIEYLL